MHRDTTPSRPFLMRLLVRSWEFRHPSAWVTVRMVCGLFNLGLGLAAVLVHGYWMGAVPLAGAALIFWTVYRLQTASGLTPA